MSLTVLIHLRANTEKTSSKLQLEFPTENEILTLVSDLETSSGIDHEKVKEIKLKTSLFALENKKRKQT